MTIQDLIYDARALVDDYNTDGVVNSSGSTAETDTNAVRYVFSGLNKVYKYAEYYNTYELTLTPTDEQKEARKWIPNAMPSDFGQLVKIVEDTDTYKIDSITQLEVGNVLYTPYWFEGTLRVIYNPYPTRITDLSAELPVRNPLALNFMINFVAAKIALTDLPQYADFFEGEANELLLQAAQPQPAQATEIEDVYNINY